MQTELTTSSSAALAPTLPEQRIEALDVVRGFALLGIFLMNIEFFNRETLSIGQGMPLGLTGIDWWASWFVAYFVQGKFWTIFSLLFGMGFAVMLTRAEQAGRAFMAPYLRRLAGLAVFGALGKTHSTSAVIRATAPISKRMNENIGTARPKSLMQRSERRYSASRPRKNRLPATPNTGFMLGINPMPISVSSASRIGFHVP